MMNVPVGIADRVVSDHMKHVIFLVGLLLGTGFAAISRAEGPSR